MMNPKRKLLVKFTGIVLVTNLCLFLTGFTSWPARITPEEEFEAGLALYKKKDYVEALKIFVDLGEKHPASPLGPDILFMQGQTLQAMQKWPEAAGAFSRAAQVHSTLGDYALYYQGEALQMAGETDKSIEVFKQLSILHPKSILSTPAGLKTAEIYLQLGEYARAAEVCANLLRQKAKKDYLATALIFLGQAKEGQGQLIEAIKAYQEFWLKYPLHPLTKKAKTRWDSLLQEKKIAREKIPPEAFYRRALHFYQAHYYEAALGEMERIEGFPLQAYPAHYTGEQWMDELYFHRGMCLFRLKEYPRAAAAFRLVWHHCRNERVLEKTLFWMMRTLFRSGQKEEALQTFALIQRTYPRGAFMDQALYLRAGIFEDREDLPQAISLYREIAEKFPQSSLRSSAMWQIGWLLFKTQDFRGAIQAWDSLQASHPHFTWVEKVLYWKGRAREKMGMTQEAEEHYQQLRKNHPTSYYNQLVASRGRAFPTSKGYLAALHDQQLSALLEMKPPAPGKNLNLEKGRLLTRLGLHAAALGELEVAEEEGRLVEGMRLEISRLYREAGEYHRSALLVRRNTSLRPLAGRPSEREKNLYLLAYPLGNSFWMNHYAQKRNLDPALLSAVILEESRFDPQAISPAGARGLMQVLPSTANQIAKRLKTRPYFDTLLFEPEMNLRLGSWYLSHLLEEFKGKEILALAAYNAGPHIVRNWLAKNPAAREDEFVENIPYTETRNYVVRVLSSAQVYRRLYGGS